MRKDMIFLSMIFLISVFLAVVYALIGPIAYKDKFNVSKTGIQIENIEKALAAFKRDIGRYPDDLEGLKALIQYPGSQYWKGPYIDKDQLKDAWGVPYKYKILNRPQGHLLLIGSSGKNKQWETTENQFYQGLSGGDDIVEYLKLEDSGSKP